jgi:two-component system, chemotaxis family, chemotaxis protein CheY
MPKVLIVDDSNLSRRILRSYLEPAGYQIIEAEDGLSALEDYFLERPDLVLLDLTMRGMSGIEVLSKLREMDAHAKVVVATADLQSSTKAMIQAAGAISCVSKPFNRDQVLAAARTPFPMSESR